MRIDECRLSLDQPVHADALNVGIGEPTVSLEEVEDSSQGVPSRVATETFLPDIMGPKSPPIALQEEDVIQWRRALTEGPNSGGVGVSHLHP